MLHVEQLDWWGFKAPGPCGPGPKFNPFSRG